MFGIDGIKYCEYYAEDQGCLKYPENKSEKRVQNSKRDLFNKFVNQQSDEMDYYNYDNKSYQECNYPYILAGHVKIIIESFGGESREFDGPPDAENKGKKRSQFLDEPVYKSTCQSEYQQYYYDKVDVVHGRVN